MGARSDHICFLVGPGANACMFLGSQFPSLIFCVKVIERVEKWWSRLVDVGRGKRSATEAEPAEGGGGFAFEL